MAVETKKRSLYYRRIAWSGQQRNMLHYLKAVHEKLNSTKKRTFHFKDGEIQGMDWQPATGSSGIFMHIAGYVPHQSSSLVPYPSAAQRARTAEQSPPRGSDFLEGDVFCLLKQNHLLVCPSGLGESAADSYIRYMLRAGGNEDLLTDFRIEPIANVDKVNYIRQHGVKALELSSSLFDITMDYEERKHDDMLRKQNIKDALLSEISQAIKAIFTTHDDPDLRNIDKRENLNVKVQLSFDGRKKGEVGKKRLMAAAEDLLDTDEDEGFKIITENQASFTADQIRIKDSCVLPVKGNSVKSSAAQIALEEFYLKLKANGVLQQ